MDSLIELELKCLNPEVRSSRDELDILLAEDFLEIPSTGIAYGKVKALNCIPHEIPPIFTHQEFKLRILCDGVAQLIYKATIRRKNEESAVYSMRNSIWKLNGKVWQMIFHQGTPCEPFEVIDKEAQNNNAIK
jgi:hypothetical protein